MSAEERAIELGKRTSEVRHAIAKVIDLTNVMSSDVEKAVEEGIFQGLMGEHRTLQASFVRCLIRALKRYGDTDYFDLRNEAAVKWARKATEGDDYIPFI